VRALAIDTSTHRAEVALWDGRSCVARERNTETEALLAGADPVAVVAYAEVWILKLAGILPSVPKPIDELMRLPVADLSHPPSWAAAERGKMRRSSMTISPITNSATLRVFENGALKTGTPHLRAASRSTWLVPTLKQPTAISRSASEKILWVSWVRERMPSKSIPLMASLNASGSRAVGMRTTDKYFEFENNSTALSFTPSRRRALAL